MSKQLKAWAMGLSSDGRSAFLHVTPKHWIQMLTGLQLEFAVRRLLRLPLRNVPGLTCSCKETLDAFGDHADVCRHQYGERSKRHNHVNHHALAPPARQAKLFPNSEAPGLVEDSNGRPADIGIENGHEFGPNVTACYDVVGCATNAKTYVEKAGRYKDGGLVSSTSRKLSNAIKLRVAAKELVIIPMAFDTQGGLHPNWRKTFEGWAERWASQGEGRTKGLQGAVVRSWVQRAAHWSKQIRSPRAAADPAHPHPPAPAARQSRPGSARRSAAAAGA